MGQNEKSAAGGAIGAACASPGAAVVLASRAMTVRLRRRGPRARSARGSVAVEFAVLLPLAAVVAMFLVQVGLVAAGQLVVQHAAREGARAAAVWNDDARARDAALSAGRLDPERATVEVAPASREIGAPVTVTVRYRLPVVVPLADRLLPDEVGLSATATMRTEREREPAPS